jgi:hypothetical protein
MKNVGDHLETYLHPILLVAANGNGRDHRKGEYERS